MTESSYEKELAAHGRLIYPNVGKSMMPLLRQRRDLMVITRKPEGRLKLYDTVLFKRGGKYILHRIVKVRENDYVLRGDNQWRSEYGVTDAQIIGVLSAVVRDGKEISVSNKKYLMYVWWMRCFYPFRAAALFMKNMIGRMKRKLIYHGKEQ